jgi:hypothetical protein
VDLLHWLAWDDAGWLNAVINENRYYLPTGIFFEKNTNRCFFALGFYNSNAIRNYSQLRQNRSLPSAGPRSNFRSYAQVYEVKSDVDTDRCTSASQTLHGFCRITLSRWFYDQTVTNPARTANRTHESASVSTDADHYFQRAFF